MNEAKQAELLPTMPEKDLLKLIRKLELDVTDIEYTIERTDYDDSVSGVSAYRSGILARYPETTWSTSVSEYSAFLVRSHAGLQSRRRARLVTRTRRLNAAREEVGKRNRQVIFGSRESLA